MASNQLTVYRGCTPVVDANLDGDGDESIVPTLIDALAEAEDVTPDELPPLYNSIDLDALTHLFDHHDGAIDAEAILSFTYGTWNVFVRADGRIRICDGTKPTDPAPVFANTEA